MINKLNLLFIISLILFMSYDIKCEEESKEEKELEDIENDMVIHMKKFKLSKEDEKAMKDKLCERNLKAEEWEKLSNYCFNDSVAKTKCVKCKEVFTKSYQYCHTKVPQTDGCNEITFNKRGACQVTVFEENRKDILFAYRDNKEEFVSIISKINECYKKMAASNFKDAGL